MIAEWQVEIQSLVRSNEWLVGYMNPAPEQKKQLQQNAVRIAYLSLRMNEELKK